MRSSARGRQVANEFIQQAADFCDFADRRCTTCNKALVNGDHHLGFQFRQGTLRDVKKRQEFCTTSARRPFSDIACNADRGPAQLLMQAESFLAGQHSRGGVDFAGQGDGFLPYGKVLVALDDIHSVGA